MAAPMVAISMSDTARRWLPKPGAWMETLKQVMAFPLYLTAVWLLWVAGKQSGVDAMAAAAAGLVMLALGLMLLRGGTDFAGDRGSVYGSRHCVGWCAR